MARPAGDGQVLRDGADPVPAAALNAPTATVRLATFNILHGATFPARVVDVDAFAAAVRALDADILALQEVDRGQPRSGGADLTAVAAEAMKAVSSRFVPVLPGLIGQVGDLLDGPDDDTDQGDERPGYGIALLSRFPAQDWQQVRLPRFPLPFPVWTTDRHRFRRSSDERRGAVIATFETPSGSLTVANAHLSLLPGVRRRHLQVLRATLASRPDPVVLMGDFNHAAPRPAKITGFRPLAVHRTFPSLGPRRQIDHILTRDDSLRAVGSSVHSFAVSDHCALAVDVELPG